MAVSVLMSGGVDSTACACYFLERREKVTGIFVNYGQLALEREQEAVERITQRLEIPLKTLIFEGTKRFGTGEITGRNAFLIFAVLMSESPKDGILSLGIHGGTGYYDCGSAFVRQIDQIICDYTAGKVVVNCPFISMDKPAVYEYAKEIGAPLSLTYSCEHGTNPPCGRCLSCRDLYALTTR